MPPAASSSSRKSATGGASSAGGSRLSAVEKRLWQSALQRPDHVLTNESLQSDFADIRVEDKVDAVNSLLSKSLLTAQKTFDGLQYQALSKTEASMFTSLDSDERIIFSQIRESGNEGIWTKQLKSRTNLHQTIMTRCLKSLESKQLIKSVKSVKFPTRKIYMLAGLTPSLELSGGPWYTDNEMDTVFINQLCTFLSRYIGDKTWPKGDKESGSRPLYLASHTPSLPTAVDCQRWLAKAQVTSTALKVEDVQSLLDVLVYDGKIEKIPCYPKSQSSHSKSRSRSSSKGRRKSSTTRRSHSSDESDQVSGSSGESESESEKSDLVLSASVSEDSDSDDDEHRKRKRRSSKEKSGRRAAKHGHSRSLDGDSRHKSHKRRRELDDDNKGKNSSFSKSILLSSEEEEDEDDQMSNLDALGSQVFVYRAIRPFHIQSGWVETPCGHCPVFNFCEPGGPVNAEGCVYMRDWIHRSKARDVDAQIPVHDIEEAASHAKKGSGFLTNGDIDEDEDDPTNLSHLNGAAGAAEDGEDDYYGGEEV